MYKTPKITNMCADVTRPFPSAHALSDPSWEFVWSSFFGAPGRAIGLPDLSPQLLQGVVEARSLEDAEGRKYTLVCKQP